MLKKIIATAIFSIASPLLHAQIMQINDTTLDVEIKGNGKHVVLFEAGAISGIAGWDSIWNKLPHNITAIRYSRRGEGKSADCVGDLTSLDYVKDTEQLVKKLDLTRPFTLVSHSYGAKVARLYSSRNKDMVSAMLFVDPINPRDIEIIEIVDPKDGVAANNKMQQDDIKQGVKFGWCLIKDIWDKSPALGIKEIGDIPMTLIAGVKRFKEPKRLFDTDKARQLWGEYQAQWANQFPRSKVVMANKSGHFVQDDEPDLVVSELISLLKRTK